MDSDDEAADENKEDEAESEDEDIEIPRSHSLPAMKWVEPRIDTDDDDMLDDPSLQEGAWELTMKRDFNNEVQTYLENKQLLVQKKARKKQQ